ncbi:DAK2 domain-containing protein [Tuberibacillus sp. Marseille-P3662]|uniref:DAK2 domain-containing protein n=1 Tax=Tuberibacillus sp. Marseille-P3662 TaxID=1965358 RepID=UPI000A1C87D8|nr:DAK2 domain-containing protein [Tuberibacillus sp. Marseille-P3662]
MDSLDVHAFQQFLIKGSEALDAQSKFINGLNVFPVPDGDTGTNMNLTYQSGIKQLREGNPTTVDDAAKLFAKGLLMGARGNSGVILSQLFRGFSRALEGQSNLDGPLFVKAVQQGVETAYNAVMKPVEGTVLTVAKDAANTAQQVTSRKLPLRVVVEQVLKEARASLQRTPDLLPVLKEGGVVDSGGQGLVAIYEGFQAYLSGEAIQEVHPAQAVTEEWVHDQDHDTTTTDAIQYGFCTEFMVRLTDRSQFDEPSLRKELSQYGDSLLVVSDEELLKVHIHTEHPGHLLNLGQQLGELIKIKIDNMREQHAALASETEARASASTEPLSKQPLSIVTVCAGDGVEKLFKSIGATVVIEGGQTMNPSTEDLTKAIHQANADMVYVLPNNSNIVMAAEQAADVAETHVEVLPTNTIPQGLAALMSFDEHRDHNSNVQSMQEAIDHVKSGQVTYAVRDTNVDTLTIRKDDFIGLSEGEVVTTSVSRQDTLVDLLDRMVDDETEIITLIYGNRIDESGAEEAVAILEERFEDIELEAHKGGQPVYDYLVAVE